MMNSARILMVLSFVAGSAFAAPKCAISIKETLNSGAVESTSFRSDLQSKRQCEVLAGLHRKNFSPTRVKEKHVAFAWGGSPSPLPRVASRKTLKKSANVAMRKASRSKRQSF